MLSVFPEFWWLILSLLKVVVMLYIFIESGLLLRYLSRNKSALFGNNFPEVK